MASRYSIIQYVPDPIADERINIGVLAFNEKVVKVQFLSKWDRVRRFGAVKDIDFLRDFAHRTQEAAKDGLLFPGDESNDLSKHQRLMKIARGWINSIQFTEPRGSLEDVGNLLEDVAKTYLLETTSVKQKFRDRQEAARVTTSRIKQVVKQRFGDPKAKEWLRTDYELKGSHKDHKFDVTVADGRPFLAAHGVSFEIQTPETLIDSLSFMILDVIQLNSKLPIGIVVLPPKRESQDYEKLDCVYQKTTGTYKDLGAKVLEENEVESWASECLVNVMV